MSTVPANRAAEIIASANGRTPAAVAHHQSSHAVADGVFASAAGLDVASSENRSIQPRANAIFESAGYPPAEGSVARQPVVRRVSHTPVDRSNRASDGSSVADRIYASAGYPALRTEQPVPVSRSDGPVTDEGIAMARAGFGVADAMAASGFGSAAWRDEPEETEERAAVPPAPTPAGHKGAAAISTSPVGAIGTVARRVPASKQQHLLVTARNASEMGALESALGMPLALGLNTGPRWAARKNADGSETRAFGFPLGRRETVSGLLGQHGAINIAIGSIGRNEFETFGGSPLGSQNAPQMPEALAQALRKAVGK